MDAERLSLLSKPFPVASPEKPLLLPSPWNKELSWSTEVTPSLRGHGLLSSSAWTPLWPFLEGIGYWLQPHSDSVRWSRSLLPATASL